MTDRNESAYVVAVTQGDNVLSVIGPRNTLIEATALADVVRCEDGKQAHVRQVREVNVFDVHGVRWAESPPKLGRGNP